MTTAGADVTTTGAPELLEVDAPPFDDSLGLADVLVVAVVSVPEAFELGDDGEEVLPAPTCTTLHSRSSPGEEGDGLRKLVSPSRPGTTERRYSLAREPRRNPEPFHSFWMLSYLISA